MFFQERQNTKIGFGLFFASPEFCILSPKLMFFQFFLKFGRSTKPEASPKSLMVEFQKSSRIGCPNDLIVCDDSHQNHDSYNHDAIM